MHGPLGGKDPIAELVGLLSRLPGVGERTAARLTYFILGLSAEYAQALGRTLGELHERVRKLRAVRQLRDRGAVRDLQRQPA